MADSEKLTALKKAYADIILNTAKEAAARIMASERKAQSYQRELFAAKDEALSMLMRLKQMLDYKATEAEMTSLNHQKRIEELEAQLGEAEDIVKDLRVELRELQDELERSAINKRQPLEEQNSDEITNHVTITKESRLSTSGSEMSSLLPAQCGLVSTVETKNSASNGTCDGSKCYGENGAHKCSCFACNPDFASIMIRSKEPELYRNGCTQRIRAFEGKLLGRSFSLSGEDDGGKKQKLIREDGDDRQRCINRTTMAENIKSPGKWPDDVQIIRPDGYCNQDIVVMPLCRKWKRKRATRFRRFKFPISKSSSDLVVDDKVQSGKDSGTTEKTSEQQWKPLATPKSPSYEKEIFLQSGSEEVTEGDIEMVTASLVQSAAKSMELSTNELEMAGKEAGSSEVPANKTELGMEHILSGNLDQGVSDSIGLLPTSPLNSKFLKYTFTRKRKRDPLSSPDGDSFIDNATSARNMEDKMNDSMNSEKAGLLAESSRNSRRLAQVALQLISLSRDDSS